MTELLFFMSLRVSNDALDVLQQEPVIFHLHAVSKSLRTTVEILLMFAFHLIFGADYMISATICRFMQRYGIKV